LPGFGKSLGESYKALDQRFNQSFSKWRISAGVLKLSVYALLIEYVID
jgi:hypothetical protein